MKCYVIEHRESCYQSITNFTHDHHQRGIVRVPELLFDCDLVAWNTRSNNEHSGAAAASAGAGVRPAVEGTRLNARGGVGPAGRVSGRLEGGSSIRGGSRGCPG